MSPPPNLLRPVGRPTPRAVVRVCVWLLLVAGLIGLGRSRIEPSFMSGDDSLLEGGGKPYFFALALAALSLAWLVSPVGSRRRDRPGLCVLCGGVALVLFGIAAEQDPLYKKIRGGVKYLVWHQPSHWSLLAFVAIALLAAFAFGRRSASIAGRLAPVGIGVVGAAAVGVEFWTWHTEYVGWDPSISWLVDLGDALTLSAPVLLLGLSAGALSRKRYHAAAAGVLALMAFCAVYVWMSASWDFPVAV
jgi:hypothetical protein